MAAERFQSSLPGNPTVVWWEKEEAGRRERRVVMAECSASRWRTAIWGRVGSPEIMKKKKRKPVKNDGKYFEGGPHNGFGAITN